MSELLTELMSVSLLIQVVKPITQPTVKHNFAALLARTPHSDKDKGKVAQLADLLEKVRGLQLKKRQMLEYCGSLLFGKPCVVLIDHDRLCGLL
jgi:hypothetical protein